MEIQSTRRLYRTKTNRLIAGVAAGLADYFSIDPVLVRALFILLTIADGAGVLIYIILWIVVPEAGESPNRDAGTRVKDFVEEVGKSAQAVVSGERKTSIGLWRNIIGLFIIFVGLVTLLHQFFPYSWLNWNLAWPILIIFIGFYFVMKRKE